MNRVVRHHQEQDAHAAGMCRPMSCLMPRWRAWAACLVMLAMLAGCGRLADKPISVAAHVWPGYELMFLARNEGWLDAEKVRLVETASATDSLQALAEGKADAAALTLDEVLAARAEGIPLSIVAIFDISAGADMLVARPGIGRLPDIKGQRIGYEENAVGSLLLASVLSAARLTREDVKLVPLTIDRHLDAWAHHQIDALITFEPVAGQLLAQGANRLFDSRQAPDTIIDVLAIRGDVLDRGHANAIRHLVAMHFRALNHLNRSPQDTAYRMAARLGISSSKVLPTFKGLMLPSVAENRRMLSGSSPQLLDMARRVSGSMVKDGLLPHDDNLIALAHDEFLPPDAH